MKKIGCGITLCALGVIIIVVIITLLSPSNPKISSEDWREIKGEIATIMMKEDVMKFIYVDEIVYETDIVRVSINLKQPPESVAEVELWTDAVAVDVVKILSKHNIEIDVSVWGQKRVAGGLKIYGRTYYSPLSKTYEFKAS